MRSIRRSIGDLPPPPAGWIEGVLAFMDQQIRELTERIAERASEKWERNRPNIGRDSGPNIDWSR